MSKEPHSKYYREKCVKQKLMVCGACGTSEGRLVVHHINGDKHDNRLENLIPMCDSCHRKVHSTVSHGRSIDRYTDQLPASAFRISQRQQIEEIEVPDEMYESVKQLAKDENTTVTNAVRLMCREGGYNV